MPRLDGPFLADTFSLLPDAAAIATFLIAEDQAQPFPFLADARIAYVLQQPALMLHGEACDAYITRATVQGSNRLLWSFLASCFGQPGRFELDFLIYIDAAGWQRRGWNEEPGVAGYPIEREALVFHELSHLIHAHTGEGEPRFDDEGRPVLALVRHTYERFDSEIRRYGPVTLGLEQLGADFVAGAAAEKARRRRGKLRLA